MKRLLAFAVTGLMVLSLSPAASAVDVKVRGQWYFHYGYYSNNTLTKNSDSGTHADRTRMRQRIRTQIDFIADENLKALLNLETNMNWGSTETGVNAGHGGLDADSTTFVIKRAYLDWTLPSSQVQIRMGMQGISLPGLVAGNPVMDADVAGVTVSGQFTPEIGMTVFWARPYDDGDQASTQTNGQNFNDEMDVFGVLVPIKTNVVRATPWAMFALIGTDSDYFGSRGVGSALGGSGKNRGRKLINEDDADGTAYAWWVGSSFEFPIIDPFVAKIDAMAGGIKTGDDDSDAFGYWVAGEFGYKFTFGTLTARGWYSSGDKEDDDRGIIPGISDDVTGFALTRYGMAGSYIRSWDRIISGNGFGMWGIGLQMADVSFVDKLTHTLGVYYMGGTNEGDSTNRRSVRDVSGDSRFGNEFFMSSDRAWEVDLLNEYKVNENLRVSLDFSYLKLELGDHWVDGDDTEGSFAAMLGVLYSF
ncbi:MAG: hypothetical protein DELT_02321 [Desulfovibrio sp.]